MDVLMEEQQEWQVIRKQIEEKETILKMSYFIFQRKRSSFISI